jgi:Pyruvate/2-oxoacid:ferredoxin oxidoreductase delta subunit
VGHVGFLKDEYRAYVERLGKGTVGLPDPETPETRQAWKTILETLATPEDAAFLARMPPGFSPLEKLATRYGMPAEVVRARLEPLCDRGLVMDVPHPETNVVVYRLSPPVVGFIELSLIGSEGYFAEGKFPKRTMAEAIFTYFRGDETFAREVFGHGTKVGRAVAYEQLGDTPPPSVLLWGEATSIVQDATHVGVGTCFCRHEAEHRGQACKAPTRNCLSLNLAAGYLIRRNFVKAIPKSRALEILAESRERGLVRVVDNVKDKPTYICNCCGCCCHQLTAITHFGLVGVSPSSVEAKVNTTECNGCQKCARACPVRAIVMRPATPSPKTKAGLAFPEITERCMGCGVCADRCEKKSIQMAKRTTPPTVPENKLEMAVQMAIDRGRLSQLFLDEGAGWGTKFLNRVLGALETLPPTTRLLAVKQIRSRFVAALIDSNGSGSGKPQAAR